ncbi:MAG: zinc-ribbon domain-containing protein [Syntrophomonadaceae bacterium]|nr:zinc-ribbon domain-containing protein [Syntrophomonadaceae bacterium]
MFCNKCGTSIPDNARLCPQCGNTASDSNAVESASAPIAASVEAVPVKTKMSTSAKLVLAAVLVIACAFGVYTYLTKPLTPEQVATRFSDALSQGDYPQAYSYFDDTEFFGREFLDEKSFQESYSGRNISEYKLQPISDEGDVRTIGYVAVINGERQEGQLNLLNVKANEKDKDNWKIISEDFITTTWVYLPEGVTLKINDKVIPVSENSTEIPMFQGYSFQAVVQHPAIQTQTVKGQAGEDVNITELQPSEKTQQELKDVVTQFNQAWITACKNKDISLLKDTLKEESDEWYIQKDYIDDLISDEIFQEENLKEISFGKVYFGENLDSAYVEDEELWDQKITNSSGDVISETLDKTCKWTYRLERQDDGSWLVVANSTRY